MTSSPKKKRVVKWSDAESAAVRDHAAMQMANNSKLAKLHAVEFAIKMMLPVERQKTCAAAVQNLPWVEEIRARTAEFRRLLADGKELPLAPSPWAEQLTPKQEPEPVVVAAAPPPEPEPPQVDLGKLVADCVAQAPLEVILQRLLRDGAEMVNGIRSSLEERLDRIELAVRTLGVDPRGMPSQAFDRETKPRPPRILIAGCYGDQRNTLARRVNGRAELRYLDNSPQNRTTLGTFPDADYAIIPASMTDHMRQEQVLKHYPRERVRVVRGGVDSITAEVYRLVEQHKTETFQKVTH